LAWFSIGLICGLAWFQPAGRAAEATSDDADFATAAAAEGYLVAKRAQDFAVYERVIAHTNSAGKVSFQTNQFTLLENGLHYLDNGEWKLSQDLIEVHPDGAVAQRSPHKAIFSHDLNAEAVFDVLTAEGQRLRGGVRSIQLTDLATGNSFVLATVKAAAPGELLPPNQLVYRDAFEGLMADVLMVWKHNHWSQNVLLRERPQLPAAMDPATTRLEVVTELIEAPAPVVSERVLKAEGKPDVVDHVTIRFGQLLAVQGKAFPVADEQALNLGALSRSEAGVAVVKQYFALEEGRKFIIESVGWQEIEPFLQELPVAQRADNAGRTEQQVAQARVWPNRPAPLAQRAPMQLASLPYAPKAFVVDVDLEGTAYSYRFESGYTYYIANVFTVGPGDATFQPDCVVKYANKAELRLSGPIDFAVGGSLLTPVFTSKNDDSFGLVIPGSTGTPNYHANPALWVYYVDFATEIKQARIRWAKRGIEYSSNPSPAVEHSVRDCLFEQCQTGIYLDAYSFLDLHEYSNQKCNVTTPVSGSGSYVGAMVDAPFCAEKSFAGINNTSADNADTLVPDTMGAIGPNYFVEPLNRRIAVFDKSTLKRVRQATLSQFFAVTAESQNYPQQEAVDPRIVYNHQHQRWVAAALDLGSQHVLLAVSKDLDPVPLGATVDLNDTTWIASKWTKYLVKLGLANSATDFPTLGVDKNGIYIAVYHLPSGGGDWTQSIAAIPINPLLVSTPPAPAIQPVSSANIFRFTIGGRVTIQPALNFDLNPASDIAWFVAKGPTQTSPSYRPGKILYGRLKWNSTTSLFEQQAGWFDSNWGLDTPQALSYFEIRNDLSADASFIAPQLPDAVYGNAGIELGKENVGGGTRLTMAVVRKLGNDASLWTCQHVGFNSSGGYNTSDPLGSLRSGCVWFQLKIDTAAQPPILTHTSPSPTYGRIYDGATSSPYFYYYPSLTISSAGHMLVGFSGSKAAEHIGAFYTGRLASGVTPARPILIQAGKAYSAPGAGQTQQGRWGDYSYTSLDPDGVTFWTVQQFAETPDPQTSDPPGIWGTWITSVKPAP
jgi:hypothetical protein